MSVIAKTKIGMLSATLLLGMAAMPSLAQQSPPANGGAAANTGGGNGGGGNGGGNNGGGNNGGGRGRWDPAQMRQRMEQQLKDELGMSDDEFTAVQPQIEKLFALEMAGRGGGRRRGGPNGGGNGGAADNQNADQQQDPALATLQEKQHDLQQTLDNKDSTADDIKTKLQAYRDAKAAVKTELTKAQDDLKSALTQRQEAVLVMRGMLE